MCWCLHHGRVQSNHRMTCRLQVVCMSMHMNCCGWSEWCRGCFVRVDVSSDVETFVEIHIVIVVICHDGFIQLVLTYVVLHDDHQQQNLGDVVQVRSLTPIGDW